MMMMIMMEVKVSVVYFGVIVSDSDLAFWSN